MEEYGKILIIATPVFFSFNYNQIYGIYKKQETVTLIDSVFSISYRITNSVKDVKLIFFMSI